MQRTLRSGRVHQQQRAGPARRAMPFTTARPLSSVTCSAAAAANGNGVHANGNAASHGKCPTPAQTVRTLIDIVNEGTLCTVGPNGLPVGLPVTFSMDKSGKLQLQMDAAAMEMSNLKSGSTAVSLMVQAATQPTRAVGAVSLMGKVEATADGALPLSIDNCLYFGGLDQGSRGLQVSGEEVAAAEPDVLRKAAPELVAAWNNERAEDIYRIVSDFMGVPLTEMAYAELMWVDHLGMYINTEVAGREAAEVVRVPFYRPVLDERDARSVITMASQIAWERERAYNPPLPSIFMDAAANN
ncbi:hypothetical protein HYH02_000833 [Chlamydomonas schloesseri]|uniref:DUF2470 domain-containing protein n=1 Tax=Chlamydomonas schloesseri TaxID=2026947 RepID=A0A835WVD4_9CHLO|nr:hypothetical protein HYH02_000833 [Chlamydomonas schloesseri]|eukprot:KAG2455008.1 hypothetical protein HYH02_000833 [Chlamydomonas schloesseri]